MVGVTRRSLTVVVVLSLPWLVGCVRMEIAETPLVDDRHRPIILTEQRALALPKAPPGNRFIRGWRFEQGGGGLRVTPTGSRAWLEVVQLTPRDRSLILKLVDPAGGSGGVVRARSLDRDLGSFDLADPVEIPLPGDLAPGRVPIELEFSTTFELLGAAVSRPAPGGRVALEGRDVLQSGWSAVDFVRWIGDDTRLVGEFVAPVQARPEQRFSVTVDSGGGSATVFATEFASLREPAKVRSIDLSLDTSGLVRIRLSATGRGPAARWRDLRLVTRNRHTAPPPHSIPGPPKLVLVYVFDALRADHIGHLGSTVGASPCVDRLASEGATFTNHFSVAPNTGPATAALFTGRVFFGAHRLPLSGPETLAEVFSRAGFATASISSNPHLAPSYGLARGFDSVEFLPLEQDHRPDGTVTVNDSAAQVHGAALRWLDQRQTGESVLLYLHTLHPHNPYTPPEPFPHRFVTEPAASFDGRTRTLSSIRDLDRQVTVEDQRVVRQRYAANVAYNDAELCGLADELEKRYPGQVMLVVTSDHGEELFDHGGVLHGYTLYDEMLHVPLVVWWPGRVRPSVIDDATDTLDLHATLRDLVASPPPREDVDGRPLWGAILGSRTNVAAPGLHFAVAPGLRQAVMARSDRWKLILVPRPPLDWGMGRGRGRTHEAEYLFHLESDPGEHTNLAGIPALEADWLWSRLQAWRAAWQSRQPREMDRTEVDDATKRQLEALGYID